MKVDEFDYKLPEELIAQTPLEKRDTSRLLVLDKKTGKIVKLFLLSRQKQKNKKWRCRSERTRKMVQ